MIAKSVRVICIFVAMFGLALSSAHAAKNKGKMKMTKEMQEQMARMQQAGTPGPAHENLKVLAGTWEVAATSWMAPGAKAETSTGTSSMEWVLDGRFVKQEYKGDWSGMPFHGIGYIGYNNMTKKYVSTWMDSMSTGLVQASGDYDTKTKTITDEGTYSCPMTGDHNRSFRSAWTFASRDKLVYKMFSNDKKGKEYKSMELVYTRKK